MANDLQTKDYISIVLLIVALLGLATTLGTLIGRLDSLEKRVDLLPPDYLKEDIAEIKERLRKCEIKCSK